jgi:hypothetical protein
MKQGVSFSACVPSDVQTVFARLSERVEKLPPGFVSVPKWKELVQRCETCRDTKDLKNLKISLSKWEKNVTTHEKDWCDTHIDVQKRNTKIEELTQRTQRLRKLEALSKQYKACEQYRTLAHKWLENATIPLDCADRLATWEAKLNEYGRLYHDQTSAVGEEEEQPRQQQQEVEVFPDLESHMQVFEEYAQRHPTDANFTFEHTQFLRFYTAKNMGFEKHFVTLCDMLKLCKECTKPAVTPTTMLCVKHNVAQRMQQLNARHNRECPDNDAATAILEQYIALDENAPLERFQDLCQRYEDALNNDDDSDMSLSSSSSSLESFLGSKHVHVNPPTIVVHNDNDNDDDDDDEEEEEDEEDENDEEEEDEENDDDNDSAEAPLKRARVDNDIVNKTCDYLLANFEEDLPEAAKVCLKLLRDGEGSRNALLQEIEAKGHVQQYDVVSTIISSGLVKHNATFDSFEEAQVYIDKFPASEYICRSVVKRFVK